MSETSQPNGIHAAIIACMRDIGTIGKDSTMSGGGQGYAYRSIESILPKVQEAFIAHGVVGTPEVIHQKWGEVPTRDGGYQRQATLLVRWTFTAADGSSVSTVTVGESLDTRDKSANKAMTAAWKYALTQLLCIPSEADDPDHHQPEERGGATQRESRAPARRRSAPRQVASDGITPQSARNQLLRTAVSAGMNPEDATALAAEVVTRHAGDATTVTPEQLAAMRVDLDNGIPAGAQP